jgi:hypothetical protein
LRRENQIRKVERGVYFVLKVGSEYLDFEAFNPFSVFGSDEACVLLVGANPFTLRFFGLEGEAVPSATPLHQGVMQMHLVCWGWVGVGGEKEVREGR